MLLAFLSIPATIQFLIQRPQNLAVHLKRVQTPQGAHGNVEAYVGWTGMASASSLAHFNSTDTTEKGLETIEIDPQYAQGLGLAQGDLVRSVRVYTRLYID